MEDAKKLDAQDLSNVSGGDIKEFGCYFESMVDKYHIRDIDVLLSRMSDEEKTYALKLYLHEEGPTPRPWD